MVDGVCMLARFNKNNGTGLFKRYLPIFADPVSHLLWDPDLLKQLFIAI